MLQRSRSQPARSSGRAGHLERDVEHVRRRDGCATPDLRPYAAQSGVRGEWSQVSGTALVEVWATAPTAIDQPDDPNHLRPWLEKLGWIPRAGFGGVAAVTNDRERNVLLPAGPALEVVVTTDPGEQRELRVVTYGIQTAQGVAVIMMRGAPAVMDQRSEDLRLIAVLAQFAPADTSRTPPPSAPASTSPSATPAASG